MAIWDTSGDCNSFHLGMGKKCPTNVAEHTHTHFRWKCLQRSQLGSTQRAHELDQSQGSQKKNHVMEVLLVQLGRAVTLLIMCNDLKVKNSQSSSQGFLCPPYGRFFLLLCFVIVVVVVPSRVSMSSSIG